MPNYRKYSHHFRAKRFRLFRDIVDNTISKKGQCRILDVGGTLEFWETFGSDLDWSKVSVKLLNLASSDVIHPGISSLAGDARSMPTFDNNSFDIVHSNSVIEHVGRWSDMVAMAEEVRRLAPAYFVQTPYFWFPIEPHARFLVLALGTRILALSACLKVQMWILGKAVKYRCCDEKNSKRGTSGQIAIAVPFSRR